VIESVRRFLDDYHFDRAASTLYQFVWHELCDWFIELIKPALAGRQGPAAQASARRTLYLSLQTVLKLLHPFIPFVTEEIWQKLPGVEGTIMLSPYPSFDPARHDPQAETEMKLLQEACLGVRQVRGDYDLPPRQKVNSLIYTPDPSTLNLLNKQADNIRDLALVRELEIRQGTAEDSSAKPRGYAWAVVGGLEIGIDLAGLIDLVEEEKRIGRKLEKMTQERKRVEAKINNPNFRAKAPADIVAKEEAKLEDLRTRENRIRLNWNRIKELKEAGVV
jgi:valyl-tRNA synthetase